MTLQPHLILTLLPLPSLLVHQFRPPSGTFGCQKERGGSFGLRIHPHCLSILAAIKGQALRCVAGVLVRPPIPSGQNTGRPAHMCLSPLPPSTPPSTPPPTPTRGRCCTGWASRCGWNTCYPPGGRRMTAKCMNGWWWWKRVGSLNFPFGS